MANNKSPGEDGMTIELFKCPNDEGLERIAIIVNDYWENSRIPKKEAHAKVVSLYKKETPDYSKITDQFRC
eukprot:6293808-Karenia_brevis.AAC.1